MRFLRVVFWTFFWLVALPWVLCWAALNFAGTPIANGLLKRFVNAPAKVEKVSVNWLLTELDVKGLEVDNPSGFPKGKLLSVEGMDVKLEGLTSLRLLVRNFYLRYIRRSDNATNLAVAFGLPVRKAEVSPLEFEIYKTDGVLKILPLPTGATVPTFNSFGFTYDVKGHFRGFGNNVRFKAKGFGEYKRGEKPYTNTRFEVYNWELKNNQYLNQLASLLGDPSLKNLTLAKVEGSVETKGDWLIFGNTKAYTVERLFAEIFKGSKYNTATKEMSIRGKIFYPVKVEFEITGTPDRPRIKLLNFNPAGILQKLKNLKGLRELVPSSSERKEEKPQSEGVKESPVPVEEVKSRVQGEINRLKEKLQREFNIKLP